METATVVAMVGGVVTTAMVAAVVEALVGGVVASAVETRVVGLDDAIVWTATGMVGAGIVVVRSGAVMGTAVLTTTLVAGAAGFGPMEDPAVVGVDATWVAEVNSVEELPRLVVERATGSAPSRMTAERFDAAQMYRPPLCEDPTPPTSVQPLFAAPAMWKGRPVKIIAAISETVPTRFESRFMSQ